MDRSRRVAFGNTIAGRFRSFLGTGLQNTDRGQYELVDHDTESAKLEESSSNPASPLHPLGATDEDDKSLRRVADSLPWSAFLVAAVELCERFTFYGLSGPFQNYISNSYHDPNGLPGAIGLGQGGATALTSIFQFWCYLTPLLGAIAADQYLGKYYTILYSAMIYAAGIAVLFLTSLPFAIESGFAMPGLLVAMAVIGLGAGGIKSNVSPLIAEQYQNDRPYTKVLGSGERVVVDPAVTIQRIYMVFYLCINIGSLSPILTTVLEARIGFWSAYLICLGAFGVGLVVLIGGKRKYVLHPPKGSDMSWAFQIVWIGIRNRSLEAAKPGVRRAVPWSSALVDEVRRALLACKVFLFFPIYWLLNMQMLNNLISQAGTMALHGLPNDIMGNINPISIIIFIPLCDRLLYPALRRTGIAFKPITRIFVGFLLAAAAMAYAAYVQKLIYDSPPCYTQPLKCAAALRPDGTYAPNGIHVALQTPAYVLIGMSEIFASITGLEYAYTQAPPSMRSLITSMFLLTTALGAILGAVVSPFAVDPTLLWMYVGLAVAGLATGIVFWFRFRAQEGPNTHAEG
ncbi:di/tri peptide transporter 2, partial [Teratosphaeria destructans]